MEKKAARGGRGQGGARRGKGWNPKTSSAEARTVRISKLLSYLLRHGAVKEGLHISPTGWVEV